MPVNITITFNPCIDKSTAVAALIPEKKLSCAPPILELLFIHQVVILEHFLMS